MIDLNALAIPTKEMIARPWCPDTYFSRLQVPGETILDKTGISDKKNALSFEKFIKENLAYIANSLRIFRSEIDFCYCIEFLMLSKYVNQNMKLLKEYASLYTDEQV